MTDWAVDSFVLDEIKKAVGEKDLSHESEAQTRFDIIDRILREFLGWNYGQIKVEPRKSLEEQGYVDYILRANDIRIVVEAKKLGASFPSPTKAERLKLRGMVLAKQPIAAAIDQALEYSRSQVAGVTVVTNGSCWCLFDTHEALNSKDAYATILFPLEDSFHAEKLHDLLSSENVASHGLDSFREKVTPISQNRLLSVVPDSEIRVDRNAIADHITPALDFAFYSESLVDDSEALRDTFVYTTSRTKYDETLQMNLSDQKPETVRPATRIRSGKANGPMESLVRDAGPTHTPSPILLIAEVGTGKSMYLRHFELVKAKEIIKQRQAHWIYVDFYKMGKSGDVREFMYQSLSDYLLKPKGGAHIDFDTVIGPAYESEVESLRIGPFAITARDSKKFDEMVQEQIKKDFDAVEPYVEKIFRHLTKKHLCVLVLDNVDLFEDDELEINVLSEGLAFARKLKCQIIISIRDTTYVKHKNSAIFDAFELKKLWLDPAPFKEILSKRLSLSSRILKGKPATISFKKGIQLKVPDLSVFFDIVQRNILTGQSGDFFELFAGLNIRRGITLVKNFLTSGHIHADKALHTYMTSGKTYIFPFHEVFKGSVLAQHKYYSERRSECINIFDSRIPSKNLLLLRLCILSHLYRSAKSGSDEQAQVKIKQCIEVFSHLGAHPSQIIQVVTDLVEAGLAKQTDARDITIDTSIFITRPGGYLLLRLSSSMVYVEECMYDTYIADPDAWRKMTGLTYSIEREHDRKKKLKLREERLAVFLGYLNDIEDHTITVLGEGVHDRHLDSVQERVMREIRSSFKSLSRQGQDEE